MCLPETEDLHFSFNLEWSLCSGIREPVENGAIVLEALEPLPGSLLAIPSC